MRTFVLVERSIIEDKISLIRAVQGKTLNEVERKLKKAFPEIILVRKQKGIWKVENYNNRDLQVGSRFPTSYVELHEVPLLTEKEVIELPIVFVLLDNPQEQDSALAQQITDKVVKVLGVERKKVKVECHPVEEKSVAIALWDRDLPGGSRHILDKLKSEVYKVVQNITARTDFDVYLYPISRSRCFVGGEPLEAS